MKKKTGDILKRALPIVMAFFLIILHMIIFRFSNFESVEDITVELLKETCIRKAQFLSEKIRGYSTLVSSLAFAYAEDFDDRSEIYATLSEMEANTDFDYIRFMEKNGFSTTSQGVEADCSDRAYYKEGISGKTGVCDVEESRLNGETMIGFYSPIVTGDETIGVLVAFISQKNLTDYLVNDLFGFRVDTYMVNKDGLVVGSSGEGLNKPIMELLGTDIIGKISPIFDETGEIKTFSLTLSDALVIVSALDSGYYLVLSFPLTSVDKIADTIGRSGNSLFLALSIIFILYIIYNVLYFGITRKRDYRLRNLILDGILNNDDMVLLLDDHGGVELVKKGGAYEILNTDIGSVIPLSSLLKAFKNHKDDEEDDFLTVFHNAVESVRSEESATVQFVSEFNFDGKRGILQFIFRYQKDKRHPIVVVTVRQVTDVVEKEREAQERLSEALDKAEAATKAKSTFLANMSHDLRTPMNAILGYTNLALSSTNDPKKEEMYLGRITESSKQLLTLLNDILDMTLIEGGKMVMDEGPMGIRDLFASIESITETSVAAKGQMLHISVGKVVHEYVVSDKVRLNQILLNCVTNAIKYTPEGGDIWLSVDERPSGEKDKGIYEFRVRDTGIGMSKEFLKKIWEPFERERNSTVSRIQGTGLGMSITRNLVSLMGGEIQVVSEEGKGSEFIVSIPLLIDDRKVMSLSDWAGRKAIVFGNTKTAESLLPLLESLGIKVTVATDCSSLNEKCVGTDIAFVDMKTVRKEGMESLRAIRDSIGKDALMVVTAYKLQDGERDLASFGVDAYAPKPVFLSDIKKILSEERVEGKVLVTRKEMDLRGRKVLLVEDNDLNREIATIVLEDMGMKVEAAENGKEAIEKVKAAPDDDFYSIVLMDIQMPIMNGYDATRGIRALSDRRKRNVPILSMTANAFPEDRKMALEAGMDGHVSKPIEATVLVSEMIEAILSREK